MAKKVSGASDYIIPLGVVGVLGFLAWKFFSNGLPQSGAGANNQSESAANTASTGQTAQDQAKAGEVAQMSAVQQAGVASQLYSLMSQSSPDLLAIASLLESVYTLTDLNAVIKYFGTKQVTSTGFNDCAILGWNCSTLDLPGWVALTFNGDLTGKINEINNYYSTQGINFAF